MATVTRRWRRLLAVGCSHGNLASRDAIDAVLRFRRDWKPDTTIHLGDFLDTAAFRSGAKGSKDESEPIAPDVDAGLQFLKDLSPTHVFCGNHEARLWSLAEHHNAIVAECAAHIVQSINTTAAGIGAKLITYKGVWSGLDIGGFRYCHGTVYNENACRDMAEMYGNVVFAHTHRAGVAKGRRSDNPTGYCVGTLTSVPNMDYASTRRATLSWSAGFVWGEYTDTQSVLWLHEQPTSVPVWRLPSV
jgi:hypothetical protein